MEFIVFIKETAARQAARDISDGAGRGTIVRARSDNID